jgi:exodeoxyribonuclease VII large subunit
MSPETTIELGVREFIELVNQVFDYSFTNITIIGELANLRVSKGKWLYFDLKEEDYIVKFFGLVYQLPGPLEDGMVLKVQGTPRLHAQYGFSVNVQNIQPVGQGTIRRAAELLRMKLSQEGLFDESRKRSLPYPPRRIGLITSKQSAAYADFIKILGVRFGGVEIDLIDVQVQGEVSSDQITAALKHFNTIADEPDVLVIIRGGGSAEDLSAFSSEVVARAVASSRIPTLVAVGHETDISLAELAADKRASTPSNAAELLVPDRTEELKRLENYHTQFSQNYLTNLSRVRQNLQQSSMDLDYRINSIVRTSGLGLKNKTHLLRAFDPQSILRRGYAIIRHNKNLVDGRQKLVPGDIVNIEMINRNIDAQVIKVNDSEKAQKV